MPKAKPATVTQDAAPEQAAPIMTYKGFDADWKCRDFQYAMGESYENKDGASACNYGFHACEYPLDVLNYYPAVGSKFASVEQGGTLSRDSGDTKVASSKITIKAEIGLPGLIKAAIEYTMSRVNPAVGDSNKDEKGSASNSGDSGAASNSGDSGAASNSGYRGAASNSGDSGAASNSGDSGAASNSGDSGAASNSGKYGIAADFSGTGRVQSSATGAIVCVNRNDDGSIRHIRAATIGQDGIKSDTWYSLNAAGEFVES